MFGLPSTILKGGYPQLSASASPNPVSGTGSNAGAITITSNATTVTPVGGQAPYTYAWTVLSGSFSITSPSAASTTFSESLGPGGDSGQARCTVTSTDGQVTTCTVNVSLTNTYVPPNPPVWNVGFGTNLGTWVAGGGFHFCDLYAVSPTWSQVVYNVVSDFPWGSGNSGPEPWFPYNTTVPNGAGGQFGGQVSAGTPPGDYQGYWVALNPADNSSSLIQVFVTVV